MLRSEVDCVMPNFSCLVLIAELDIRRFIDVLRVVRINVMSER